MSKKARDITTLILALGIIVIVNFIGSYLFERLDLTSDDRYTLSEETIDLVQELDDIVYFKVYLKGDMPPHFDRLKTATKEMLDELRAYQETNIQYEFVDPSKAESKKKRNQYYANLKEKGLNEIIIPIQEKGGRGEKILFPGAIVSYQGKEVAMQLLDNQSQMMNPRVAPRAINRSINNLEYEIGHTIRKLKRGRRPQIALIQGHGELAPIQVRDYTKALEESYRVDEVTIKGRLNALEDYDAAIIAKPDSAFSDKDKFVLDQFIMNGGKVMWLIDPMKAEMDSLERRETTLAVPKKLNLDDQLFTYGVRLNKDLLIDGNCARIGIVTGMRGNRPQIEKHPWYYYPTAVASGIEHPISGNIDPVRLRFVSSLDTVGDPSIKKTILLNTSENTRVLNSPVRISLAIVNIDPNFRELGEPHKPVAALLEGKFRSVFKGRIPPRIANSEEINFKAKGKRTKMMVVADGDVIRNKVDEQRGVIYPLGYDKYARRKIYGNKEFLLNGMEYLLDEGGNAKLRTGVTLRKLNPRKIRNERYYWQVVNVAVPVLIIILFGGIQTYLRKRKYSKRSE